MILREIILRNFRGYKDETRIPINNLTAFIGKNDAGKSSILDALAIFFDHQLGKIDSSDICVFAEESGELVLGCVFSDFPAEITIDDTAVTSLGNEYLLNNDGYLEIHKIFNYSNRKIEKPKIFAIANHPSAENVSDLLQKKNSALKSQARNLGIIDNADARSNVSLRHAIWEATADLRLQTARIQLDKIDEKAIYDQIQKHFPLFALFRADRPSTDEDAEVQDPLKIAVKQAIAEVSEDIENIKNRIQERALDVARRTLLKLADFDSTLAEQLLPDFKSDPKWDTIFKLSLLGDNQIPVNKRGSGVRRLILFSFFRAEAERMRVESYKQNVIFAIEEPETAQHPDNQIKLFESLEEIVEKSDSQILLTTHVPGLAALLPTDSIRYIQKNNITHEQSVAPIDNDCLATIAKELGVIPDKRAKVLLCVEGPNDIHFLKHMSSILFSNGDITCDVFNDFRFAQIILGGNTLQDWVSEQYLRNIGLPEFHLYDRDDLLPDTGQYHYQSSVDTVNQKGDGSSARLTTRRETENYLHIDAINAYFNRFLGHDIVYEVTADADVTSDLKPLVCGHQYPRNLKALLNREVAEKMTVAMLHENGTFDEIKSWFDTLIQMAQ